MPRRLTVDSTPEADPVPAAVPAQPLDWPENWLFHTCLPLHTALKGLADLRRNLPPMLAEHRLIDTPEVLKAALRTATTARLLHELDGPAQAAAFLLLDDAVDRAVPIRQAALRRAEEARRQAEEDARREAERREAQRLAAIEAEKARFAAELARATEDERRRLLALQAERDRLRAARLAELDAQRTELARWQDGGPSAA
jgi:hypothetical protein